MNGDDRAGFAEVYGRATQSGNLKHDMARPTDPDKLIALALTDRRLSAPMFRAKVANDAAHIRNLIALWRADVMAVARHNHWCVPMRVQVTPTHAEVLPVYLPGMFVWAIADASIHAWLWDVCPACTGRKFSLAIDGGSGKSVLSDKACVACAGTGRSVPDVQPVSLMPFVEKCLGTLRGRFERAEKQAKAKLR